MTPFLQTLNQRVHGSSPCAPTNNFNGLARYLLAKPYFFKIIAAILVALEKILFW